MKFKEPCWPKDLHGMIMVDDDFLLPEVWFRHVPDEVEEGEPTAYAVGFTTAMYTERLQGMTQQEVSKQTRKLILSQSTLETQQNVTAAVQARCALFCGVHKEPMDLFMCYSC